MKRSPLFLKLFYSYIPLITLGVLTLIVVVNYSTQNFYDKVIKQQLDHRASNIISWLNSTQLNQKNNDLIEFNLRLDIYEIAQKCGRENIEDTLDMSKNLTNSKSSEAITMGVEYVGGLTSNQME